MKALAEHTSVDSGIMNSATQFALTTYTDNMKVKQTHGIFCRHFIIRHIFLWNNKKKKLRSLSFAYKHWTYKTHNRTHGLSLVRLCYQRVFCDNNFATIFVQQRKLETAPQKHRVVTDAYPCAQHTKLIRIRFTFISTRSSPTIHTKAQQQMNEHIS